MIKRQIEVEITLRAEELAEQFCNMCSDEQADFFNEVARVVSNWSNPFALQLQGITDEAHLNGKARYIMKQIGEYSSEG